MKYCRYCNKSYAPRGKASRYCCNACRQAAYRENKERAVRNKELTARLQTRMF